MKNLIVLLMTIISLLSATGKTTATDTDKEIRHRHYKTEQYVDLDTADDEPGAIRKRHKCFECVNLDTGDDLKGDNADVQPKEP